jgi:hypothetical protein
MRKMVAALTLGTALVAVPTASAEPMPGCRAFGEDVSAQAGGPGAFGQTISPRAHGKGDPLFLDRLIFCAPPLPE